jgi:DNA-binding GntR family transcriptional regulator
MQDQASGSRTGGAPRFERRDAPRAVREGDDRNRLHEEVYGKLKMALISGTIAPGQSFTIRGLAEIFGTSAMPVRDALKRLVAERAFELLPNRTVSVPMMTRRRFQEILQVRLSLEPMISRKALERMTPAVIAEMEALNDTMRESALNGDIHAFLDANRRFHFRLYETAETIVILPIVESLWMQIGPFLNLVFNASGTKTATDSHLGVLRSLRRNDPIGTGEAIAADLASAADLILATYPFEGDDARPPVSTVEARHGS